MKKIYTLPNVEVIATSKSDVIATSWDFQIDTTNRENIAKDPFAPVGAQILGGQEA